MSSARFSASRAEPCSPAAPVPLCSPTLKAGTACSSPSCPPCTWGLSRTATLPLSTGARNFHSVALSCPKLDHEDFQLLSVFTQKCFLCCATSSWPRPCASSMQLMEAGKARVFCWYWGAFCRATLVQEPHSPQSVLRTCLLAPSIRRDCGNDSVGVSRLTNIVSLYCKNVL